MNWLCVLDLGQSRKDSLGVLSPHGANFEEHEANLHEEDCHEREKVRTSSIGHEFEEKSMCIIPNSALVMSQKLSMS